MSQRALKKRDLLNAHKQEKEVTAQIYRKLTQPVAAHKSKNLQRSPHQITANVDTATNEGDANVLVASKRKYHSTPNLTVSQPLDNHQDSKIIRAHSESNVNELPVNNNTLVNAKSEFHLKSIVSTEVPLRDQLADRFTARDDYSKRPPMGKSSTPIHQLKAMQSKRMSIQSGLSTTTACSMTSSASDSTQPPTSGFADAENIRIPIIGYEVMEERARFTVNIYYKYLRFFLSGQYD